VLLGKSATVSSATAPVKGCDSHVAQGGKEFVVFDRFVCFVIVVIVAVLMVCSVFTLLLIVSSNSVLPIFLLEFGPTVAQPIAAPKSGFLGRLGF
jgi:hypothetical protein